jgi:hypothetical protein
LDKDSGRLDLHSYEGKTISIYLLQSGEAFVDSINFKLKNLSWFIDEITSNAGLWNIKGLVTEVRENEFELIEVLSNRGIEAKLFPPCSVQSFY